LVVVGAKNLLIKHGDKKPLRALDALQLSACLDIYARRDIVIVCADTRLIEVAELEGLKVFNPEKAG
jgi:hypothetical protein